MMGPLTYTAGSLHMDGVNLAHITQAFGTPCYVYSATHIRNRVAELKAAFADLSCTIHYSVKANSNLHLLKLMHEQSVGFDIVSGGELSRVLAAGGNPQSVIFSGVGKRVEEIDFALKAGIKSFNVESASELNRLASRAGNLGKVAPVSLRVNPNVNAGTHPYISTGLKENKFGVDINSALDLYLQAQADPNLDIFGIDCHIGSQITQPEPLLEALTHLLQLADELGRQGIPIRHIDLGGGMGIRYRDETPLDFATYGSMVSQIVAKRDIEVLLEPGRSLTANAGVLLARVEYLKPAQSPDAPNFAVVDTAMNDLIRPALYQAWHDVLPVRETTAQAPKIWDIVGPVCESGDFLAKGRSLGLSEGDLLAIASAGAYGFVQSSNYNTRCRPPEVLVEGNTFRLIRRRETIDDQLRFEQEL